MLTRIQKSKANDAAIVNAGGGLTVDFGDSQDLRVIADQLLRLDHILETNSKVYEALLRELHLHGQDDVLHNQHGFDSKMNPYLAETDLQRNRVLSLLKRMRSSSELVGQCFGIFLQALMNLDAKYHRCKGAVCAPRKRADHDGNHEASTKRQQDDASCQP